MKKPTIGRRGVIALILSSTSLIAGPAFAQAAASQIGPETPAAPAAALPAQDDALEDIVVTAQRREQNLQDVPIAITALDEKALEANRVVNVNDLSGLAPGVTVRPAAGGTQTPSFTIRGAVSYGVVPGSDKQVSIYLDGVYIASPRGSIFDLPDVARIELLRGPQGTLFGRNATAGAVSVNTRDPEGGPKVRADFTIGNYDQYRMRLSVDLPQVGPFTGYLSYVHNYKRGDIRNLGAGQFWDRSRSPNGASGLSPKYLGTRDSDSYFAAVKFQPSDSFNTVYKYDLSVSENTPEGTGFVGYNAATPLIGNFLTALITSQPTPVPIASDGRRPKAVSNSWAIPSKQRVEGHNLTSVFRPSDNLTIKNIASFRRSRLFAASAIDGISALTLTRQALVPYATFVAFSRNLALATASPAVQGATIGATATALAPLVGSPFVLIASQVDGRSKQYSDELQATYDSELLTLTVGGLYFHADDVSGSFVNLQNTLSFTPVPGGVLQPGSQGISYNKATSLAGYVQSEFHVAPQIDVIGGFRLTSDRKSGRFEFGLPGAIGNIPFRYRDTRPSYLIGVNYKPIDDMLLYGKFSTAFVSGGSVAGIEFRPETAQSYEAGVKADLFGRRLRTSLSLFHVRYEDFQVALANSNFPAGTFPNQDAIGVLVYPQGGPVTAKGFEADATARLVRGLTAGGSLSYTDTKFKDVDPILTRSFGGQYLPTLRPKWTGSVFGQVETQPLAGNVRLALRADGTWRSSLLLDGNQIRTTTAFDGVAKSPARWIVNGRAALTGINFGGPDIELAVWGRNVFDNKSATFALIPNGLLASANYESARTYGLDVSIRF